jgi:general secretion pathway protein M
MNAILPWWRERSERERILLGVLGTLLAIAILVTLIVQPLLAARAQAKADIRTYETLNIRLRAAGNGPVTQGPVQLSGPPATIVQTAAGQAGVAVVRSEPDGARTRAIVEQAPFPAVLQWLATLDSQAGVRIVETRIERTPAPGMVAVKLVFQ